MNELDNFYRALLVKYMKHVYDSEGMTFVEKGNEKPFTPEEWTVLQIIDTEATR
jgi:hypothetical protein